MNSKGQLRLLKIKAKIALKQKYYQIFEKLNFKQQPVQTVGNSEQKQGTKNELKKQEKKSKNSFHFQYYIYPELNNFFQKYATWKNFTEKRPVTMYDIKSNLLFLVGPQQIGKSFFINYNISTLELEYKKQSKEELQMQKKLQDMQINSEQLAPLIINYDLKQQQIMNFDTFLSKFENQIISEILKKDQFLNSEIILQILLNRYDQSYLQLFLKDTVYGIMHQMDFRIQSKQELEQKLSDEVYNDLLDEYISFEEAFLKISEILNPHNPYQGSIELSMSLLYRIEHEYRENSLILYRDGIQISDFFFDILNFLCGYHELNKVKICDTMFVFQNFHDLLLNYSQQDNRIFDFFDHLVLRLFTSENQRTHFPVVIETNHSRLVTRDIFQMMHQKYTAFPIIELLGYQEEQDLLNELGHIYDQKQIKELSQIYGLNIKDWKNITEEVLQNKDGYNQAKNIQSKYNQKEYTIFCHNINSLFANELVNEQLDSNEIDFALLDILEELVNYQGKIYTGTLQIDKFILENPIVQALIDKQIIYNQYYKNVLQLQKQQYFHFMIKYIKEELRANMSLGQKIKYKIWKKKHGIDSSNFEIADRDINLTFDKSNLKRENIDYEVFHYGQKIRPHHLHQESQKWYLNLI